MARECYKASNGQSALLRFQKERGASGSPIMKSIGMYDMAETVRILDVFSQWFCTVQLTSDADLAVG